MYLQNHCQLCQVAAGRVLVKIAASSVNPVDTMIHQMGEDLPLSPDAPAILGMDFAGTIEEVGDHVEDYSIEDEVCGCANDSRFARHFGVEH